MMVILQLCSAVMGVPWGVHPILEQPQQGVLSLKQQELVHHLCSISQGRCLVLSLVDCNPLANSPEGSISYQHQLSDYSDVSI